MHELDPPTHQKAVEITGKWWIVGQSRRKVSGTLHVDATESGIRLEVFDLMPNWLFPHHLTPARQTILGEADDNRLISLHNCYTIKSSRHRVTYRVGVMLLNAHTRKLADMRFESMFMSYTNLEQWMKDEPIRTVPLGDNRYQIESPERPIDAVEVPEERFTLQFGHNVKTSYELHKHQSMSYESVVYVTPKRPIDWATFNTVSTSVARLLTLLSGEPNSARRIGGTLARSRRSEFGPISDDVYVYRSLVEQTDQQRVDFHDLLFTRPDVGDRLAEVCGKWFRLSRTAKPVFDVLFAELRTRSRFLESHFFHVAQCVEAFHRVAYAGGSAKYMPKAEFRKLQKQIVEGVPSEVSPELLTDIKRVLHQANQWSFLDRLQQMFASLEPATAALVVKAGEQERFMKAVRDTRNRFTHLEEHEDADCIPQPQWYDAANRLLALIYIHMLKMCGFPEPEIVKHMKASRRFGRNPFQFIEEEEAG